MEAIILNCSVYRKVKPVGLQRVGCSSEHGPDVGGVLAGAVKVRVVTYTTTAGKRQEAIRKRYFCAAYSLAS